jgi:hypothetical protein
MFSLPQGPETEGKIEQRPLRLEGITKRDFELFLSMLYTKYSLSLLLPALPKLTGTWLGPLLHNLTRHRFFSYGKPP